MQGQQQGSGASGSEWYGTALRYAGHRRWTRQDSRAGGCENEGRTGRVDEPLYRGKHTSMVRVYKSARTDTDIAQTVEKNHIHALWRSPPGEMAAVSEHRKKM